MLEKQKVQTALAVFYQKSECLLTINTVLQDPNNYAYKDTSEILRSFVILVAVTYKLINDKMTLSDDNIFDGTSDSSEQTLLDKRCADLMIQIHQKLDLRTAPIKKTVQALGVTPAQARNLAKGNVDKFSFYELKTFLQRLSSDIK
jgi:predicted XRE-type DNA-binding protein